MLSYINTQPTGSKQEEEKKKGRRDIDSETEFKKVELGTKEIYVLTIESKKSVVLKTGALRRFQNSRVICNGCDLRIDEFVFDDCNSETPDKIRHHLTIVGANNVSLHRDACFEIPSKDSEDCDEQLCLGVIELEECHTYTMNFGTRVCLLGHKHRKKKDPSIVPVFFPNSTLFVCDNDTDDGEGDEELAVFEEGPDYVRKLKWDA